MPDFSKVLAPALGFVRPRVNLHEYSAATSYEKVSNCLRSLVRGRAVLDAGLG